MQLQEQSPCPWHCSKCRDSLHSSTGLHLLDSPVHGAMFYAVCLLYYWTSTWLLNLRVCHMHIGHCKVTSSKTWARNPQCKTTMPSGKVLPQECLLHLNNYNLNQNKYTQTCHTWLSPWGWQQGTYPQRHKMARIPSISPKSLQSHLSLGMTQTSQWSTQPGRERPYNLSTITTTNGGSETSQLVHLFILQLGFYILYKSPLITAAGSTAAPLIGDTSVITTRGVHYDFQYDPSMQSSVETHTRPHSEVSTCPLTNCCCLRVQFQYPTLHR